MSILRFLPLALAALSLAQPAAAEVWRTVNPLVDRDPVTIKADRATVRLEPQSREVTQDGETFEVGTIGVTVQFDGAEPFAVTLDDAIIATHGLWVGVILSGYTGGMHCCATLQVVARHQGAPVVLGLPMMDGDPDTGFPRDRDGDGTAEIQRADDHFLYAFTSYAGSWPPPRLYNLRDGALVDVSAEPRFARFWQREAKKVAKYCRKGQVGACAAYAAAMARQGRAEEGIATALKHTPTADWLPEPCTVDLVNDECPEGKALVFSGFEEGLRWLLTKRGYLP